MVFAGVGAAGVGAAGVGAAGAGAGEGFPGFTVGGALAGGLPWLKVRGGFPAVAPTVVVGLLCGGIPVIADDPTLAAAACPGIALELGAAAVPGFAAPAAVASLLLRLAVSSAGAAFLSAGFLAGAEEVELFVVETVDFFAGGGPPEEEFGLFRFGDDMIVVLAIVI